MTPVQEGLLVLVADDDRDILALVAIRLERSGYRVVQATNGDEALELAVQQEPDLAVLDLMMPGLTGLEVTRALREDERTRDLPVILLTARAQESDLEAGLAAGATAYVAKPFSPQELCDRVDALLGARATTGGHAVSHGRQEGPHHRGRRRHTAADRPAPQVAVRDRLGD